MIMITKKGDAMRKGVQPVAVWKATHKTLLKLSGQTGRSMAEIIDIAVSHVRVSSNGKK